MDRSEGRRNGKDHVRKGPMQWLRRMSGKTPGKSSSLRCAEMAQMLTTEISAQRRIIQELREELLCLVWMIGTSGKSKALFEEDRVSNALAMMGPLEIAKLGQRRRDEQRRSRAGQGTADRR